MRKPPSLFKGTLPLKREAVPQFKEGFPQRGGRIRKLGATTGFAGAGLVPARYTAKARGQGQALPLLPEKFDLFACYTEEDNNSTKEPFCGIISCCKLGKTHVNLHNPESIALDNQPNETASPHIDAVKASPSALTVWIPLIGPLLMAMLTFVLVRYVVNHGDLPSVSLVECCRKGNFAATLASATWSISVLFYGLTVMVMLATVFRIITDTFRSIKIVDKLRSIKLAAAGLALSLVLVGALAILLPTGQRIKFNEAVLDPTVYPVSNARPFVTGAEILVPLSLAALALAVSLILSRASRLVGGRMKTSVTTRAAYLARNQHHVRKLLYISAISLVAGTLMASALYAWAHTIMTANKAVFAQYLDVIDLPKTMGILNGSLYSIFLAGIFAPAFLQLRGFADQLANEAKPDAIPSERKKWLEENAISETFPQQLVPVFAVLSPMLAGGPLTAILQSITN